MENCGLNYRPTEVEEQTGIYCPLTIVPLWPTGRGYFYVLEEV